MEKDSFLYQASLRAAALVMALIIVLVLWHILCTLGIVRKWHYMATGINPGVTTTDPVTTTTTTQVQQPVEEPFGMVGNIYTAF